MSDKRVVLHVGAPKSGTTYLQSRLQQNHEALLAHGVLVPQASVEEGSATLMFRAALDLTGIRLWRGRDYADGRWDRLVAATAAHDGTTLISDEAFVRADDAAVARAVRELSAEAELHVVWTARDLGRALVSTWLENLKHGRAETYADLLERARTGTVLRQFEIDTVLGRWLDALGDPARVHLVTLPPEGGDRSLLWTRFLEVAGVDPTWVPAEARQANDSIGLPEAQFLRALNEQVGGAAERGGRLHGAVRDVVVGRGLAPRSSTKVRLDPRHEPWVVARTEVWVDWVRASGIDVTGDLADLTVARLDPADWVDPDVLQPDALAAADAALDVVRRARGRGPGGRRAVRGSRA
ncbi:hypothetical protein [Nocardioides sp.]|uniref:hypothetical protein n=1 Tax=Nocardioides sp. TaxID=35761 RepID=UPI00271B48DA|nr:hypothetical protein [Nocardioides sp.]MDO9458295.1 hypothetical protein [Nocardioides sp.]